MSGWLRGSSNNPPPPAQNPYSRVPDSGSTQSLPSGPRIQRNVPPRYDEPSQYEKRGGYDRAPPPAPSGGCVLPIPLGQLNNSLVSDVGATDSRW
jgi:hypothetical protein